MDLEGFVSSAKSAAHFDSVELVEVVRSPRTVDVHLGASTGQQFVVSLAEGGTASRITCDGYVFDRVPSCLALEFMAAVVSGEVKVSFSRPSRDVVLSVSLAEEGSWMASRRFRGDLAQWELDVMGRAWQHTLERAAAQMR
ncbi:hypothetical protein [Kitasatospora sp. P5_F3]